MRYLLDTNVISEVGKRRRDPRAMRWIDALPSEASYVSVLTLGEIRFGVETMGDAARRRRLLSWLERDVMEWFEDRILPIDLAVADRWARLRASAGRPLPLVDSLLAATALQHGLALATRNEDDFRFPGLEVINPWKARPA